MNALLKYVGCACLLSALGGAECGVYNDTFHEELVLKPLHSEQLYAYFQFTTEWDVDTRSESFQHCHLFPRGLAEIVGRYDIAELHVSLTAGLWRYESWGYPVVDAAPGVELWTWFEAHAKDVDRQWRELANALSGLFCASLNFIDGSNSLSPEYSLRPWGVVGPRGGQLRYATLPREVVCTENLTPWKKLLPCDSKRGLASLLNSQSLHATRYHSLGVHLRPVCGGSGGGAGSARCDRPALQLRQTVSLVYDYLILGTRDWSLRRLFNQGVYSTCPLAASSKLYVDVTAEEGARRPRLSPPPDRYVTSVRGGARSLLAQYDVERLGRILNVAATHAPAGAVAGRAVSLGREPPLHANQYIGGFGQERGSVLVKLHNALHAPLDVAVLQHLPWYVPVYLHTLRVRADGRPLRPLHTRYVPGRERVRPYQLELLLRLPPRSQTVVSLHFDYVFLKWQEYPPDANHGFYIPSTVVSCLLPLARNYTGLPADGRLFADGFNASRPGYLVQIRTESLLVTLPTPDFSMPYNVICLACTVVALAFGPLHNITTKRLRFKSDKRRSAVQRLRHAVLSLLKPKAA